MPTDSTPDESQHGHDDEAEDSQRDDEDAPRVPEHLEPDEQETKRFMVMGPGPALTVRVSGGDVQRMYAPARLVGELAAHVAQVVQTFNGGRTMLYAAEAGESMVLYFGDPVPDDPQDELPVQQTRAAAELVAGLIDLSDDALFVRALELGPQRTNSYDALVHFVQNEGVTLGWTPRDDATRTLNPKRAAAQRLRLHVKPELQDRDQELNGILYRVITDPASQLGKIGIGLFEWSAEPPGHRAPSKVLIHFEGVELQTKIKGLIGEAVAATVTIRQPRIGTAIDLEKVDLQLVRIEKGPGDASAYGMPLFDPD